ncbi:WD-40 repeat-containing protein [Dendrothele bispora CBS 962.96]|uniref:ASTRA-associated protein 1 n=1 Tax=Dendrothele bispora (strain CBS 962.96) TaxID=1314807 RepID=A0A4S8MU08_DENBC|nr:WD-40 repeat-containing protein [Dendrothele bispora CBS 962.96]
MDPPVPKHLLRSHSSPITALYCSDDNKRIYSADSSGLVVVTSSFALRAITSWKAHSDGVLGVEEWENSVITHGRDNKLHVWACIHDLPEASGLEGSSSSSLLGPQPTLNYSMDVNALNYCRFSLLRSPMFAKSNCKAEDSSLSKESWIALPNLVESSEVDIWTLPSCDRLHAAIGKSAHSSTLDSNGRGEHGIIMALHLFSTISSPTLSSSSSSTHTGAHLRLLTAYENGRVILREYSTPGKAKSVEGRGWEAIWNVKLHNEAILAMRVSRDNSLAITASADHLLGRYEINQSDSSANVSYSVHRTKHPGNSAIALRDDGRICAIGGWDGKIRLYSSKSFKPLGTLRYHKGHCQALEFARSLPETTSTDETEEEDELTEDEKLRRSRWLLGGAQDNRVSIWELITFEK